MQKEKNLPFFIEQLKKLNRTGNKLTWIVYDDLLKGIAANPNLAREQFLDIYPIVPFEKQNMMSNYAKSNPDIEDLRWIWGIAKQQEINNLSAWFVGRRILRQLNENDDLYQDVVKHFEEMQNQMFILNERGNMSPNSSYRLFLEFMMSNQKNLDEYDRYLSLYKDFIYKRYEKSQNPMAMTQKMNYRNITQNRYLDTSRIKKYYDNIKNLHEDFRVYILANLLECSQISEEFYDKIIQYRKEIKTKEHVNDLFKGAVRNTTHMSSWFEYFYKYLKKELKPRSKKYLVFSGLVSNPSLKEEQLERMIELLINQDLKASSVLYGQIHHIVMEFFKRDDLNKDQIKRLLTYYLDYFNLFESRCYELFPAKYHEYYYDMTLLSAKDMPEATSELGVDDDFFNLILDKVANNRFRLLVLSSLFENKKLSLEQYQHLVKIMGPVYFPNNELMNIEYHPQKDIRIPHEAIRKWASCKYVIN